MQFVNTSEFKHLVDVHPSDQLTPYHVEHVNEVSTNHEYWSYLFKFR